MGGVFYVVGNSKSKTTFIVESSIFIENFAYLGGGIGFSSNIMSLKALIFNSSFYGKYGSSKNQN